MRIALISCVSRKLEHAAPAGELYVSTLFRSAYAYAKQQKADVIFILSAKYGLVPETTMLDPYNLTLNSMGVADRKQWASHVVAALQQCTDIHNDEFLVLAGERYREFLVPHLAHYTTPLQGLGIGRQLAWYKQRLK